jgi:hypothetical protein
MEWNVSSEASRGNPELELELIQTQMAQRPMLRVEVYARALRASQNLKIAEVWCARDAPYGWAGRRRVRGCKALVWGGVISEVGQRNTQMRHKDSPRNNIAWSALNFECALQKKRQNMTS